MRSLAPDGLHEEGEREKGNMHKTERIPDGCNKKNLAKHGAVKSGVPPRTQLMLFRLYGGHETRSFSAGPQR